METKENFGKKSRNFFWNEPKETFLKETKRQILEGNQNINFWREIKNFGKKTK